MAGDQTIEDTYKKLFGWCESRGFAGADPFDALNSGIFQVTPLRHSRPARFAFTQLVKRSPVNLRPVLAIPAGVNPKGIALFALAELSRYRATRADLHRERAEYFLERLLSLGDDDAGTLAFGYNFDWQSRNFFAPKGTPTIVPTAFASQAFAEAADVIGDRYQNAVDRIAEFAATLLQRPVEDVDEVCFSYTPLDNSVIYNASLLAAECLSRSTRAEYQQLAGKAVNFVVRRQRDDGAWSYGEGRGQDWVDNFHTAYVLLSLKRLSAVHGVVVDVDTAIIKGTAYWIEHFFLADGTPRYYDHATSPTDIHSAAVAIAAASELGEKELAERVLRWTFQNMLDVDGFFYYRVGNIIVDQTPYMRWGQAWMAYAIAKFLEAAR